MYIKVALDGGGGGGWGRGWRRGGGGGGGSAAHIPRRIAAASLAIIETDATHTVMVI